ncbi:MAG TPA: ATP-binding protein [Longimicrobiales bacterium]
MTLRLRYLLSLIAVIVIMAVPAIYGVTRLGVMRDIALDLREQAATSAIAVGNLRTSLAELSSVQRAYVAFPGDEYAQRMWNRLNQAETDLATLRDAGYADAVDSADIPIEGLRAAIAHLETLVDAGLLDEATNFSGNGAAPLLERANDAVPQLAAAIERHTAARVLAAERTANAATTAALTAMLIAIAVAGALAVAAAGVFSAPIQRLALAMARVADGVFDAPRTLPYDRHDEIGALSRSFRAMTARLEQLDRMKAEFLGAASQGLKTPIGVIGGYAELIREEANGELTPRHRQLLAALTEQTDVLRRRLDQLLEMSRMESGTLALGLEEVYLRHFVNDVQREHAPRAAARGLQLTVRLDEHTPPFIVADPDLLRVDILGNVIGNAIQYTPTGGTVDVVVRPDGDVVVFEIADSGPGLPEHRLANLFDKHGRDGSAGAGLGLAIARAAVQAHNGRIDGRNLPGGGARFRIALPVTQSSSLESSDRAPVAHA